MLVSMTVRNIALIENLQIDFHKGMNVLSGETGAGKSIIVDSINLVLGGRADRGLIRSGCEKASVEALMDISACPQALEVLREQQIEADGSLLSIPARDFHRRTEYLPGLRRNRAAYLFAEAYRAAGGRTWSA